ncbi:MULTISPECIES: 1,2-phenylacetyl-CoA epoxidase subunit PaaE [Kytococcus]|uniref:Phenylacetate-CoA oxygenase/reductase subunit PaaK n=1 Tax=Kytococcus schroeteri TaxID=138300 RepID=A0A2I1P9J0_9MICO|nr:MULTISPECIES: 1,2-phenylacetyl-CoA epoxidase subunit PaaE [Kytococcus]OFS13150.1 phenylacetic acid degradation protein [Kytococcus sp. HMSC28H12]PKZ41309.1 phenylacetate-CoA oxygenase/reductase subunit PaaK [Kytococcus schroeteri]
MSPLSTPTRRRATFHPLRVARVERLTDTSVAITFDVPDELAEDFAFEPGQHLTLRAEIDGVDVRRSYSICLPRSRALRDKHVRVAVSTVPQGVMSNWLVDHVSEGDELQVMTPMGTFVNPSQPDAVRHHVAIAAGSGITPVMSLLGTLLEEEPGSRATLIFGNRRTDSIMFLEELADYKNQYPGRFQLLNVLSREPQEVELLHGRIDAERLERIFSTLVPVDQVDHWYLCGPFGMVETARELLAAKGVAEEVVHHEVFHVEDAPPQSAPEPVDTSAPPEAVVTVTLDGRRSEVPMPSRDGETILDATLRERPDAPFSCTGGVCGTCRVKVLAGEVRMDRNYALEPDEVEAGYALACQSHPVTDTAEVDFDV